MIVIRGHGDRTGPVLAHGTNGKKMVVCRNAIERRLARLSRELIHVPARFGGLTPENLEPRPVCIVIGRPADLGVGRNPSGEIHFSRRRRCEREFAQCLGIRASYVTQEREIEVLHEIAIFDAAFGARRLVLVVIILEGFGEANGG